MLRKILISLVCLSATQIAYSEVMECYSFNPLPGKTSLMLEHMNQAAEIHESLGAVAGIYAVSVGGSGSQYDYCLRWNDSMSWAKTQDKMRVSKEFQDFFAKVQADPGGTLISSGSFNNLDPSVKATDFQEPAVFQVISLSPAMDRLEDAIERVKKLETLFEERGFRVEVYSTEVGSPQGLHALVMADSWTTAIGFGMKEQTQAEIAFEKSSDPSMYLREAYTFQGQSLR